MTKHDPEVGIKYGPYAIATGTFSLVVLNQSTGRDYDGIY